MRLTTPGHLSHGPAVRRGRDAWTESSTTVGASTTWPQAIEFDEEGITRIVANISELVAALPAAVQKCLARFPGVDRTVTGYEGLIVARECVRDNAARDRFAADHSYLAWLWESTDPSPESYEAEYRWLSQVCELVKPSTGAGKLLWHTLWVPRPSSSSTGTSTSTPFATMPETLATPTSWTQCLRVAEPDKKSKEYRGPRLRAASADTCAIPAPAPSGSDSRAAAEARAGSAGRHQVREVTARAGPRRGRGGADPSPRRPRNAAGPS